MNDFLDEVFWKQVKLSGLKVGYIAKKAGLGLKRISEILNGHVQATPEERQRIQAVLAITIGKVDGGEHQHNLLSHSGVSDLDRADDPHSGVPNGCELISNCDSGLESHNKLNNQARSESK